MAIIARPLPERERLRIAPRPLTFAQIGTSITANGLAGANGANDSNFLLRACLLSSGRYHWAGTFGLPGGTARTINAQLLPLVLALSPRPGYCLLEMGQNDTHSTDDFATFKTWMKDTVRQLLNAGIEPVIGGITPDGSTGKPLTQVTRNHWLFNFARDNGLLSLNWQRKLVDPATGGLQSGYQKDVTHPNSAGAEVMATYLLAALDSWHGGRGWYDPPLVISTLDTTSTPFVNNLFLTDNNSDGLADGLQINNGASLATFSLVAPADFNAGDADTLGHWQLLTRHADASGTTSIRFNGSGFWVPLVEGHVMFVGWRFSGVFSGAAQPGIALQTGLTDGTNVNTEVMGIPSYFGSSAGSGYNHDVPPTTLTQEGTLLNGATNFPTGGGTIYTGVSSGGTGCQLAIAQVTIRDLTELNLLDTGL